ncbi:MAG: hypothetical protein WKF47_02845 [Geodermatophilaceae bacterium]
MGVVLALAAALAYGLSDFLGGLLSRRISPWTVALLAQSRSRDRPVGGSGNGPGRADRGRSGLGRRLRHRQRPGNGLSYRGLGGGQMNVVAPLSALGAAVVPVAVGFGLGERPEALTWIGIGCALPAIWLVSRAGAEVAAEAGLPGAGVRDGLLAGAGFGLLFVALGQVPGAAGPWAVGSRAGGGARRHRCRREDRRGTGPVGGSPTARRCWRRRRARGGCHRAVPARRQVTARLGGRCPHLRSTRR